MQSWYQGGVSIVDFTDAAHPFEIGYFDRGPVDDVKHAMGGQWSTYWYNGFIYGSEIARGVDVFALVPTKYLTQNEIDAAKQVQVGELNVQNQEKFSWPSNMAVAKAYVDQLARGTSLTPAKLAELNAAIAANKAAKLRSLSAGLDKDAASAQTPKDAERLHALARIFTQSTTSAASTQRGAVD